MASGSGLPTTRHTPSFPAIFSVRAVWFRITYRGTGWKNSSAVLGSPTELEENNMDQLREEMWAKRARQNKARWQLCGWLWLIFIVCLIVSSFIPLPAIPVALNLVLAILSFLYAALAMQSAPTRATVVYNLRRKVAWGRWAIEELEKMGEDPFIDD